MSDYSNKFFMSSQAMAVNLIDVESVKSKATKNVHNQSAAVKSGEAKITFNGAGINKSFKATPEAESLMDMRKNA